MVLISMYQVSHMLNSGCLNLETEEMCACIAGVPDGLVGGPRAYQINVVGSSPNECMLVLTFFCVKK